MRYNCAQNAEGCTHEEGEIPINNFANLRELFDFMENNLMEFNINNDLINILPQLHTNSIVEAENSKSESSLLVSLNNLLQQCEQVALDSSDTVAYEIVLQIIYQSLTTLLMLRKLEDENDIKLNMHNQIMAKLIENMFEENRKNIEHHHLIQAKELACVQLYLRLYTKEEKFIIKLLWSKLSENWHTQHYWEVLAAVFDYFVKHIEDMLSNEQFYAKLQEFLLNDQKERRKAAAYLMRKLQENWQETIFHKTSIVSEGKWWDYITIMENVMENHSESILPALTKLEEIVGFESTLDQIEHDQWTSWLHILYEVLLMHQDGLVKRRCIEFLLKNTKWQSLDKELQELLLNALNSNDLYNKEGYFLSETDFKKFFNFYSAELYEVVAKINWKSVPLHYFLNNSANCPKPGSDDLEVFIELIKCVEKLQNHQIRLACMRQFCEKFDDFENLSLSLKVIFQVVETQKNCFFNDFLELHFTKIVDTHSLEVVLKDFDYFSRNFYSNLHNRITNPDCAHLPILEVLKVLPKKHHGYMCFFLIFSKFNKEFNESKEILN